MSDIVIDCENLGKRYRIGSRLPYHRFSDLMVGWAMMPFTLAKRAVMPKPADTGDRPANEDFWALRDINLQVKHGEVIGIIGHNGAGKSTFFKLLSRITAPSAGRATVTGRLGSLLEVGTGFHPELTGRENIFLYGAILGMTRPEIKSKFDQIVDFAETEKFLDTPVKRYSSGMYMRLAFSVAAHLDTEILLVDEVLAVGDSAFQDKCLGKMGEVGKSGRTVIFVSHNLDAVRKLCERAILLDHGRMIADGHAPEIITQYLDRGDMLDGKFERDPQVDPIRSDCWIDKLWIEQDGLPTQMVESGKPVVIHAELVARSPHKLALETVVRSPAREPIMFYSSGLMDNWMLDIQPGRSHAQLTLDLPPMAKGTYFLDISVGVPNEYFVDILYCALKTDVINIGGFYFGWQFKDATNQGQVQLKALSMNVDKKD